MKKCKECGAPLEDDELFCGECGAKVESEAGEPQTEEEVEEEEEPEVEESDEEDGSDEADAEEEQDDSDDEEAEEEEPEPVQKKPAAKKTSTSRKSSGSGRKKTASKSSGTKTTASKSDDETKQEEVDDTGVLAANVLSLPLMAIALKLLANDHTIISGILTYIALGLTICNASAENKKNRPLLFICLFLWSGISLYLADNDHPVFAWSCLLALACTTGGLSSIKKKLAIVPLVVTLGVAVALFVLF